MPPSQDDISAIQAWAKEAGCAIGGIHGQDGDMSVELAEALCADAGDEDMPNILYVRTTQLEAELLEAHIHKTFPGDKDHIRVWMGDGVPPYVAFTTYSTLRNYLGRHTGKEQSLFTAPTVVVFEHEMGMYVEGLITRDVLARVASLLAEDQDGLWVRILGLSYYSSPKEWLQHPCRLLGGQDGHAAISLSIRVKAEARADRGDFNRMTFGEEGFKPCAADIALKIKLRQNVVVFSTVASFDKLRDVVQDVYPWDLKIMKDVFWEWPEVRLTRETHPVFTSANDTGYLICMPHDRYPCALPFSRVGMVLMMPPGPRRVYNEMARVCLKTETPLTEAQFRIESGLYSPGWSMPDVVCFLTDSEILPRCPAHFINREDDPLAGWLSAVSAYPGCPIVQLPFFGALRSPTHSLDCLIQLQVMGLVTPGRDTVGYELTQKGLGVMEVQIWLRRVSLSGLCALADVMLLDVRGNFARSAARLILLLEHYSGMVEPIAGRGDIFSGRQLRSALQEIASSSTHGGPGREHVDRGSLWAAWVVFEEAAYGMEMSLENFQEIFTHAEVLPKSSTPPFLLRRKAVRRFVGDLAFWEQSLGLAPLEGNDWTNFRLDDHGADKIQEIMARAYYPYLMDVPVRVGAVRTFEHLHHSLYRSKAPAQGLDPMYNLYKCMWADNVGDAAQSSYLYAGLSRPTMGAADNGQDITADIFMIMPHATAVGVDQDGVDSWARGNAGL